MVFDLVNDGLDESIRFLIQEALCWVLEKILIDKNIEANQSSQDFASFIV